MKNTTVNQDVVDALNKTTESLNSALDMQVRENTVINDIVKTLEAKVLSLSDEKERYLEDLLKLKSSQVEQFDEMNQIQADLDKKTKELKVKEKDLEEQMAAIQLIGANQGMGKPGNPGQLANQLRMSADIQFVDGGIDSLGDDFVR